MAIPGVPFKLNQQDMGRPDLGALILQAMQSRDLKANAETQEAKLPYIGRQSEANLKNTLADVLHKGLVDKYYGKNIESEMALRGAQGRNLESETKWRGPTSQANINNTNSLVKSRGLEDQLTKLKLKYPGFGESGVRGDLAYAQYLQDQQQQNEPAPRDNTVASTMQSAQQPNQMQNNVMQSLLQQPGQKSLSQMQQMPALANSLNNKMQQPNPLDVINRNINADLSEKESKANYYKQGGGKSGVATQQQYQLQSNLAKDNPEFTEDQVREAAGNLVEGKKTLNDGTPFNASGLSVKSADNVASQGTPAAIRTQTLRANQAEAELQVLGSMAKEDFTPFATTYAGYSPEQIAATFKPDEASQKKLGRFIASQAAQYEIAQIRNRIAGGEPGIMATNELMGKSGQVIKSQFPKLSAVAREEASDRLDEYLNKALKARNKYGSNFSQVNAEKESSSEKNPHAHLSDEELDAKIASLKNAK